MVRHSTALVSIFLSVLFLSTFSLGVVHAETSEEAALRAQIDDSAQKIRQLQAEIAALQVDLNTNTKQKQTLQSAIQGLNLNIQKLTKTISLTQAQINQKDKEIKSLSGSISTTTSRIGGMREEVAESLRSLTYLDAEPVAIQLLGGDSLSHYFNEANTLQTVRTVLNNKIDDLNSLKQNLQTSKTTAESRRRELANLKQNLSDQQKGLSIARESQKQLLSETQNKESNYQRLIAQKKAQEEQFEQDLAQFESKLNLSVKSGSLPRAGSTVLSWPVDQPYITQYFGNTPFATANAQVYNNKGHNAIDLRASPGTPIKAARSGIIKGTGDTDKTCPGASYGRWVFIDHGNGISTIYAHLSVISVSSGQTVSTGEVIGYSGNTGYSTGPHLHFGAYASSGSEIMSFASKSCRGKTYTMPVADVTAYLNPLSYLPAL